MGQMSIRRFEPGDEAAAYRVCLRTGDGGGDATGLYDDPDLLGHLYLGAYLKLAPEFAFVVADDGGDVLGYCVGVPDTLDFERRCEQLWWPALRERYARTPARASDARLVERIRHPYRANPEVAREYPAHLHIDLLPQAQGQGHGRALMLRLLTELTEAGVPGVHLGVAARNLRAIAFYERLGFATIERDARGRLMARRLP